MRRPLARATIGVVIALALAAAVGTAGASTSSRPSRRSSALPVTGYAGSWTAPSIVDRQAPALSSIGVDGIDVTASGAGVTAPSTSVLALLAAAHAEGLRATLLLDNYDAALDAMSPRVAERLLTTPRRRSRVAAALVRLVRTERWDGITLDLESLSAPDGPGLVALAAELRRNLPRRDAVAVDVSSTASTADAVAIGYRLRALSKVADVVLMAYDESGPWTAPGPIGSLPWERWVVGVAREEVPASRLVLGVGTYGYAWPAGAKARAWSVTDAQARQLVSSHRARPRWRPALGEWTARLGDGTVVWWSNARSFRVRVAMARGLHLAGVAVWQLSSADQLPAR